MPSPLSAFFNSCAMAAEVLPIAAKRSASTSACLRRLQLRRAVGHALLEQAGRVAQLVVALLDRRSMCSKAATSAATSSVPAARGHLRRRHALAARDAGRALTSAPAAGAPGTPTAATLATPASSTPNSRIPRQRRRPAAAGSPSACSRARQKTTANLVSARTGEKANSALLPLGLPRHRALDPVAGGAMARPSPSRSAARARSVG